MIDSNWSLVLKNIWDGYFISCKIIAEHKSL